MDGLNPDKENEPNYREINDVEWPLEVDKSMLPSTLLLSYIRIFQIPINDPRAKEVTHLELLTVHYQYLIDKMRIDLEKQKFGYDKDFVPYDQALELRKQRSMDDKNRAEYFAEKIEHGKKQFSKAQALIAEARAKQKEMWQLQKDKAQ